MRNNNANIFVSCTGEIKLLDIAYLIGFSMLYKRVVPTYVDECSLYKMNKKVISLVVAQLHSRFSVLHPIWTL